MERFKIVEKKDHNAVHGLFWSVEAARLHLTHAIPSYCKRGYFMDKTLTPDCFEVIETPPRKRKK
jgi:hypothetical protein